MTIHRIVFDGGPMSGKTTTKEEVLSQFGPQIIATQEVATVMFREFFQAPDNTPASVEMFMKMVQIPIMRTQETMEDLVIKKAEADMARVALFDRAKPSSYGYWPWGITDFEKLFGEELKQDYSRYDKVFFMETWAASNPQAYEAGKSGNTSRYENAEQAVTRDKSLQEVWKDHPGYTFLSSTLSMEEKNGIVLDYISNLLSKEIELKFRLSKIPDIPLGAGVHIRQGYFDVFDAELRLRQMGNEYFITGKGLGDLSRLECERSWDKSMFELLWPNTQGRRIEKIRYFVPFKGFTIEIDIYMGSLEGLIIAEVELPDESTADWFRLPDSFPRHINVTNDPKYKNRNLIRGIIPPWQ